MFYKFIYKNKKTGETKHSQVELEDADLELVSEFKSVDIKATEIKTKK